MDCIDFKKLITPVITDYGKPLYQTYTIERINDVFEIMERYSANNMVIPIDLINELKELINH